MPPHLRIERQDPAGWMLAEGPQRLGEIHPDHITFVGFPDAASAHVAAEVAARVLQHWQHARRTPGTATPIVTLTPDGLGFTFAVPPGLWHALVLELAQRIHAATRSLRNLQPEPAA